MAEANYYQQRNIRNIQRTAQLLRELPPFCTDFFVSIENTTAPLTRLNYAYDLRVFFSYVSEQYLHGIPLSQITLKDVEGITAIQLEQFLSYLSCYTKSDGSIETCSEKAKARKLASVKALYRYLFNRNMISVNHTTKVATPKLHQKEIVRLDEEEVGEILSVAESGYGLTNHQLAFHERTKIRDNAILTLFLGTGIRISELVGLNNSDIDLANGSFRVTRKGGNRMVLYYAEEVAVALDAYLTEKETLFAEYDSGKKTGTPPDRDALFLSSQGKRISVRAVENLVKKYAKIVTPLKNISPHKLRSTYGTNLYNATRDIYVVADVLGHKDVNTTKRHYANISDTIRREAATKVTLRQRQENDDTEN